MLKTVIVFGFLLLCIFGRAQSRTLHRKAGSGYSAKSSRSNEQPVFGFSPTPVWNVSNAALSDVLVATNEDCLFLINNEVKGIALKEAFLYLKLPPGTYQYTAKSQLTGDVWNDTFSVAKQQPSEIFIDMLYAVDAANEKRTWQKKEAATVVNTSTRRGAGLKKETSANRPKTGLTLETKIIDAIVGRLVPIRGGSFVMGNNKAPVADEAEHSVLLNDFFISKYEVTQEQWEGLMAYNPSLNRGCPTCPVENVTWEEVMKFIRKLNSSTNKKFRLPTEAEWEYVARLGGKTEIEKAGGVEAYIQNTAWSFVNAGHKTHPVGEKAPNVAGVYDLFGNVSEWCMDWYGAFFFKEDDTEKNPEGPPLGKEKIIRGGNYKDYVGDRFRPSFRNKMNPKSKGSEVGFRLVMEGP